jgi:hypothetical protein
MVSEGRDTVSPVELVPSVSSVELVLSAGREEPSSLGGAVWHPARESKRMDIVKR